jgi:G3E family GTPase
MAATSLTPVTLLTGFLGSGKTTLLNHMLRDPAFADCAVLVNEFGAVPIDHLLVREASENIVVLANGCVCCSVAGDLVQALRDLYFKRAAGEIPAFRRAVIETTGLADPAPLLHTLIEMPVVAARYALSGVIATVDAEHGMATLDRHRESVKQAAVADRIVITKIDRVGEDRVAVLEARLAKLNPGATILRAANGEVDAAKLFDTGLYRVDGSKADVKQWLAAEIRVRPEIIPVSRKGHYFGSDPNFARHDERIRTFVWTDDRPLPEGALEEAFGMLLTLRGDQVLRVKGLVNVEGSSAPLAIHAVQHSFYPPARLAAWPDGDRRSRIVFIVEGLDAAFVAHTLDTIIGDARREPAVAFAAPARP